MAPKRECLSHTHAYTRTSGITCSCLSVLTCCKCLRQCHVINPPSFPCASTACVFHCLSLCFHHLSKSNRQLECPTRRAAAAVGRRPAADVGADPPAAWGAAGCAVDGEREPVGAHHRPDRDVRSECLQQQLLEVDHVLAYSCMRDSPVAAVSHDSPPSRFHGVQQLRHECLQLRYGCLQLRHGCSQQQLLLSLPFAAFSRC